MSCNKLLSNIKIKHKLSVNVVWNTTLTQQGRYLLLTCCKLCANYCNWLVYFSTSVLPAYHLSRQTEVLLCLKHFALAYWHCVRRSHYLLMQR